MEEEEEEEEEEIPKDVLNPLLKKLMDQCCNIWFGGHGSSSQDMAQGTKNEEPTIQKFSSVDYVIEFYEVGLLQMKDHPTIGVSPDGVARVFVPGDEFQDQEMQLVCVEIKTRVKARTIFQAESRVDAVKEPSVDGEGEIVTCILCAIYLFVLLTNNLSLLDQV